MTCTNNSSIKSSKPGFLEYRKNKEVWLFSVIDIIQALLQQPNYQKARKYWNKLKERLNKEGSEVVTNCHRLKLKAEDGKMRLTD